MIRLMPRRSNDVTYFTRDAAREIEGLRDGDPGWWLRGGGDTRDPRDVARTFTTSERSKVVGYDLVIAAPRPISTFSPSIPTTRAASLRRTARQCAQRWTISKIERSSCVIGETVRTARARLGGERCFLHAWRESAWGAALA